MNYKYHIIRNFPKGYPLWKKAVANILFFFGKTIIYRRKNKLTEKDFKKAIKVIKRGDVVLVGGLRRFSHFFIGNKVTHSLLYVGDNNLVHSIVDGVEKVCLKEIFSEYDTMIILRPMANEKVMDKVIKYAEKQIGKPYDFEFKEDGEKFYCAELIKTSFEKAGFEIRNPKKIIYPIDFIANDFKMVLSL